MMDFQNAGPVGNMVRMLTQLRDPNRRCLAVVLTLVLTLAPADNPFADSPADELVDISYIHAVVFGTGTYSIRNRRMTMIKIPIGGTLRTPTPERAGWRWTVPTVLGYDDLSAVDSDIIDLFLPEHLLTVSAMPGVEYAYPVNRHWYLKPFVELGGGRDFSAKETFFLTQLGVRSLSVFELPGPWSLRLGAALRWAGEYQRNSKDHHGFGIVNLAVDVRRRLPLEVFRQQLDVGSYYIYERYLPRWTFGEAPDWRGLSLETREFGLSMGIAEGKKLFGFTVARVRVGYKSGGNLTGWTVGTEFPF